MTEAWGASEKGAEESQVSPPPELFSPPKSRRWPVLLVVIAGVAMAFGSGTWAGYQRLWRSGPPPASGLRLVHHQGALLAMWNPDSPLFTGLTKARLEVREGSKSSWKELDRAALTRGVESIESSAREVSVRLHGNGWKEAARYVGPRLNTRTGAGVDPLVVQAREEVESDLDQQKTRNRELESNLESLRVELRNRLSAPAGAKSGEGGAAGAAVVAGVRAPAAGSPQQPLTPAGPQFSESFNSMREVRPVPPAPVKMEAGRTAEAYAGPRAGRILWTGLMKPNTVLKIRGSVASTGRVSGALPKVAVKLRALPATHGADGLVVYSAIARHRTPEVEPPGPSNEWRRLTFQYDAGRAQQVHVSAQPAAATGWSEYSIQARSQAQTAILIEWELAR